MSMREALENLIGHAKWVAAEFDIHYAYLEEAEAALASLSATPPVAPTGTVVTIDAAWRAEANAHIVGLRQCSIFADDAGQFIAKQMRESADFIEAALSAPTVEEKGLEKPSDAFARWLDQGPRLAKAAGCYVGIKVTENVAPKP